MYGGVGLSVDAAVDFLVDDVGRDVQVHEVGCEFGGLFDVIGGEKLADVDTVVEVAAAVHGFGDETGALHYCFDVLDGDSVDCIFPYPFSSLLQFALHKDYLYFLPNLQQDVVQTEKK